VLRPKSYDWRIPGTQHQYIQSEKEKDREWNASVLKFRQRRFVRGRDSKVNSFALSVKILLHIRKFEAEARIVTVLEPENTDSGEVPV